MEQAEGEVGITVLPAVMDLTAAGPLASEFVMRRGSGLAVDGSGVERMGAQCFQVLLAARAAWNADGHPFALRAPSAALAQTLEALGAADLLTHPTEEYAA